MTLRPVRLGDLPWLVAAALDPELAGVQYGYAEVPLQLVAAPARAVLGPFVTARIVMVDGRRAGYIGRSPLSGSYEYFLRPWARGGGAGRATLVEFIGRHRAGDRGRKLYVRRGNERSWRTLRAALDELGYVEGREYATEDRGHHKVVILREQA